MLKKTITFEDFDGNKLTEDFYFNLTKTELIELEVSEKEGFGKMLQKVVAEEDNKKLLALFKDFIRTAYGVKSEDGKRFIKSPELSEGFLQTQAFDELIFEFFENPGYAATFLTSLLPKELGEKVAEYERTGKVPADFRKKANLKDLQR